MRLPKDLLTGTMTKPRLFLCETDKQRICELETIAMSGSFKFNAYSELTFTVGRTYTNMITGKTQVNPFYDKIEALRLVELEDFGYFEIQDPDIDSDGIKETKTATAYSSEYTLSQKYLDGINVNTGKVDSVEVIYANGGLIEPVILYDESEPRLSLLNIVLEKIYGWKIGHVDDSLKTMSRTFEISRTSVYDFIVQDICDKFNCFAVFDTVENTINLYAEALITKYIGDGNTKTFLVSPAYSNLGTVSIDGYKTTAYQYQIQDNKNGTKVGVLTLDNPPADASKIEITDGSQEQWGTDVYVSFDNLAQEVSINYSADDIKTVLTVKGADDLDIREVNIGLPYLVDISYYYSVDWMGQDLYDAYTRYLKTSNEQKDTYTDNAREMLRLQNEISFEENRTSLKYGMDSSVNSDTVGTYYIISGGEYPNYTYKEVSLPKEYNANVTYYKVNGVNVTEEKVHTLYSAIRKYFVTKNGQTEPELKDIATRDKEWEELLEELTASFDFVSKEYATLKAVITLETPDDDVVVAVRTFLDIIWTEMGYTPLKDLFLAPYELIKATNVESGYDQESSEYYWFYYPVNIMIDSLNNVITIRKEKLDELRSNYNTIRDENAKITESTSIYNNFTPNQLVRLSAFLREDEYTDDNYVTTEIDTNDNIIKTKQELLECGRIELSKLCEPKLAFTMDMANIYALPEFEPIIHQFQLGNLINVAIRSDYIKRARLLQVDFNFDDFSDFSCEFGELTNLRTPSSIHADLLASALTAGKSVASNASYWSKGYDTATSLSELIKQGLLDANIAIKAIDSNQGTVIDRTGIHLRKVNQNTGQLDPEEGWIVNNQILYSSDNFKTNTEAVFGKYTITGKDGIKQDKWGLLAKAVMAGSIIGSEIEGGTINIGEGTFVVDQFGHVTMKASTIDGYVTDNELSDVESDLSSRITVTENGIATKVSKDAVISTINQSAESVTINANKISLAGKVINLTSDDIEIKSTNFNVTKDGKITAKSGEIAGWTIYDSLLRKETVVDNVTYQMYMQASDGVNTSNAFAVRKKNPDVASWDVQFAVNYAGKMTAKNANVTGTITAKDGSIAGYNIGPGGCYGNALYKRVAGDGTGVDYEVGLKASSGDTDLAFYVKESADDWATNTNNFFIRNNGHLYAKNADITGKITASSGKIGGWNIGTNDISGENGKYKALISKSAIGASGNVVFGVYDGSSWTCYMDGTGKLVASNADISGKITATSGSIGGCSISNGVLNVSAANITSGTIATARIPNLSADKITAGTINADRIPNISASKITSGTISTARLDSSVITTSNFSSKTLSTGSLTVNSGCRFGAATEYNALLYTVGDYTNVRAFGPDVNYGISWYALIKQAVQQSASSRDIKTEIHGFDERYDKFFDNLTPQLYKYDFATVNGYSMGYIWEETKDAYLNAGLTSNDVGAVSETESVPGGKELDRTDFIALNTWQIQKLKARVEELENKLAALGA